MPEDRDVPSVLRPVIRGGNHPPPGIRRLVVWFLMLQAAGTSIWWVVLLLYPASRQPYLADGAPDSTLFPFVVPDMVFYILGSLIVAWGLARKKPWAWPVLCVHTGAIVYSALYGLALPLLSGGGWGSLMMLPSAIIELAFVWLLRPVHGNERRVVQ
jgi:hypothetical protein